MRKSTGFTARTSANQRVACSVVHGIHSATATSSSAGSAARNELQTACQRRLRANVTTHAITTSHTATRATRSRRWRRELTRPF